MKLERQLARIIEDFLEAYAIEESVLDNFARLIPPGDCGWRYHKFLQSNVKKHCDRQRSCVNRKGCGVLSKSGKKNVRCAGARNRINQECYRGGNRGHRQAEIAARTAANGCRKKYRYRKCVGQDFYD